MGNLRQIVARGLTLLTLALLCGAAMSLVVGWLAAACDGQIPVRWGVVDGNHGPWRHYYPGRQMIGYAIGLPILSLGTAILSLPFYASKVAGVLAGISVAMFLLVMTSLFWLID